MSLSKAGLERLDREIAKYPPNRKQSAVMAALWLVQEEAGWISPEAMTFIADYLGMPRVTVEEVATFYTMYNSKPVGQHKLVVCTTLPCVLRGADVCLQKLEEKLGIKAGETSADQQFTLQKGECMGSCGDAPLVMINDKTVALQMDTIEKIDALLKRLSKES
jgi:NADH-quinone oxidoreductase subunit E